MFGTPVAQQTTAMLDFQRRLLRRALEICGDAVALRIRLGADEHSLKMWLDGKARLPERAFLKAADIVLEDDIARAEQDRRAAPRVGIVSTKERTSPSP